MFMNSTFEPQHGFQPGIKRKLKENWYQLSSRIGQTLHLWCRHSCIAGFTIACLSLWCLGSWAPASLAKRPAQVQAIPTKVELGSVENSFRFSPSELHFKAGKLYKLTLSNPSPVKHYFTSKDFADAIWTAKVAFAGVEVKGKVSEIELQPDAKADWSFVPIKVGRYELECTVPGHAMAGMVGTLVIDAS
jgi:uncharacterized cupredoxin-like copper-binding protein